MKPSSPSSSSLNSSFKSKKILRSTSNPSPTKTQSQSQSQDPNTPHKPIQPRSRRGLSLNQIKQFAQTLNKSPKPQSKSADPLDSIGFVTPSKKKSPKKPNVSTKLPERFELLAKFFDDMQSTMRLLKLKATKRSFTNICPGVQTLSDRTFSYTHLAQMKYILPEAIELKKITMFDHKTCCIKSDIEIDLLPDAVECVENGKMGSGYSNLSKVFRNRVLEFLKSHPEEEEIPLGELPEPFNERIKNSVLSLKQNYVSSSPVCSSSRDNPLQNQTAASHMSQSFKTRFTQKVSDSDSEKTPLLSTSLVSPTPLAGPEAPVFPEVHSVDSAPLSVVDHVGGTLGTAVIVDNDTGVVENNDSDREEVLGLGRTPAKITSVPGPASVNPTRCVAVGDTEDETKIGKGCSLKETLQYEGTPAKLISTPARLMTATPALQTPKRCHIIQNEASTPSPNKLVRRPPKRPLFLTPEKSKKSDDEITENEGLSGDSYLLKLLPEALRHSMIEKEKKSTKERDIAISQAKRRRQMIACLPKLFNMIHLMFQSVKGCVITKAELMHKIMASHLDIVDRAELEEQLKLLKELAPEWIQEKVACSSDLLVCINKSSCPDSVRRRLTEAI